MKKLLKSQTVSSVTAADPDTAFVGLSFECVQRLVGADNVPGHTQM